MQYCDITLVMHEGRFRHSKSQVSIPEIVVLRRIHGGDDAVVDIRVTGTRPLQNVGEEKRRLMDKYGEGTGTEGGKRNSMIEALFPGAYPKLPTNVREIATGNPVLDGKEEVLEGGIEAGSVGDPSAYALEVEDAENQEDVLSAIGADDDDDFDYTKLNTKKQKSRGASAPA